MAITPLFIGGIKNDADGINDAAQNQPAKTSPTQCVDEWSGRNHCQPAHGNIDQQRQYAPTFGQPDFLSNAKQCQPPDYAKQSPTPGAAQADQGKRSEEHTSELQSLMRISYAVFCLKKKNNTLTRHHHTSTQ